MASWWDGFTDGLGEAASDLTGAASSYFDSEAEKDKASATVKASENATKAELARIEAAKAELEAGKAKGADNQKYMLIGGGVLAFVLLVVMLKR